MNAWAVRKDRQLRRVLIALLDERSAPACALAADDGPDPRSVTLCHSELGALRAHVFLHGQRAGTYGIFFEYPYPQPGMANRQENLPLAQALASLALHFEA